MPDSNLHKLHSALLKILVEIDRICNGNGIKYFLDSGTALGAVRHGGFIPWDDDADIGMFREDYEKFITVAKRELSPEFFLQITETDAEYSKLNAKIRLNNTYFPEKRNEGVSIHKGIFVDVFPFDYISDNEKNAKKDIKKARRLNKLYALRQRHPQNEAIYRKAIRRVIQIIPEYCLKRVCLAHYLKYYKEKTNTCVCYAYKMSDSMYLTFDVSKMKPTIEVMFEGRTFPLMSDPDYYLTKMYGDYLKQPPIEQQICHLSGDLRF